jgi:hypothetical protein
MSGVLDDLSQLCDEAAYRALLDSLPVVDLSILDGLDLNLPELNLEMPDLSGLML